MALNLLPLTFKSRDILQEKLWDVCEEIKEWEERKKNKSKNKNKEISKEVDEKKNDKNDGIDKYVDVMIEKDEKAEKEEEENNNDDDDEPFIIFWPFFISQICCDQSTEYLTNINNSHIITQLIAFYKILTLADERGSTITDKNILQDLGNVLVPSPTFHYDRKVSTDSTILKRTENCSDSDDESYDEYEEGLEERSLPKKKNKRRALNNKRRRINKKKKNENLLRSDCWQVPIEGVEDGREEKSSDGCKRVSFNMRNSVSYNSDHSKEDQIVKNSNIDDFTVSQTVSDIALKESNCKSIRVHEYYKFWRIYDLDVVY